MLLETIEIQNQFLANQLIARGPRARMAVTPDTDELTQKQYQQFEKFINILTEANN